jgi:hypothetical protein
MVFMVRFLGGNYIIEGLDIDVISSLLSEAMKFFCPLPPCEITEKYGSL